MLFTLFHARIRLSRWHITSISCSRLAGLSVTRSAATGSVPFPLTIGASPLPVIGKASSQLDHFLPLSSHERHAPTCHSIRSGLRSALAHLLCPLLTPASRSGSLCGSLSPDLRDTMQVSRGKSDRLHRTPAGFTAVDLGGYGLRYHVLTRPAHACLLSGFCSSGRSFATRFLQTPPRDDALALR